MRFEIAQVSLLGNRETNQDRIGVAEDSNGSLLVLGDGLGGRPGGALAAKLLVKTLLQAMEETDIPIVEPEAFLKQNIMRAHRVIQIVGQQQDPPVTPGTTAVACLIQNGRAWWSHVGDSRLYLFRHGVALYRTEDDSYVEKLYKAGHISQQKRSDHPMRNYVTQCLGLMDKRPKIPVNNEVLLQEGDIILLCSDGFWEPLDDAQIAAGLAKGKLSDCLSELAERAEKNKYPHADNTSVLALKVISLQQLKNEPASKVAKSKPKTSKEPVLEIKQDNVAKAIKDINRVLEEYKHEMDD